MTFIGSILGGWLVLYINPEYLIVIMPIMLLAIGFYFLFSSKINDIDKTARISLTMFSFAIAPLLGFYDGFFEPGTGSLMTLVFISLCGYSASKATANTKLLNLTSSFSSLIYFVFFGNIAWALGLIMMFGQFLGAIIASRMVFSKGATLIKPVVVSVCLVMAIEISAKRVLNLTK